jgi:ElaB/YqjD/DUF883 family membrane-anchored ribosome-binding protein
MAPPDELNGFGSFGGGGDSGQGGNDNGGGNGGLEQPGQQGNLIGNDDGNGSQTSDLDDVFAQFADEDADDDDDDEGQTPPNNDVPQQEITSMQQSVQNAIRNMRVTDDMIPADFDANDRGQMVGLMNRVMQQTISQSLNVVFQPVQLAMKHMASTLQSQMESKINESRTGMQDQSVLESMVPEINDPKYSGLVKQLDSTLKTKGKKAKDRATAIRKMLNQMGIQSSGGNGSNRRASNPGGGSNPTIKHGHAALDSFFGAFPQQRQQNNGGNGGR